MQNKTNLNTIYKYRLVPLFLFGLLLVIALFFKYCTKINIHSFLGWTIFLTVASFIYYRGVLETKNNKDKETELQNSPPPPPSKEEIQKKYEAEIEEGKQLQIQNIIFRCVYLFFGILLTLGGLSITFSSKGIEYFGIFIFLIGALFTVYSIFTLRKWILLYKIFKREQVKKNED